MKYRTIKKEAHNYEQGVIERGQFVVKVYVEKFAKNWEYMARVWFLHSDGVREEVTMFVGVASKKADALTAVKSKVSEYFAAASI